MWRISISPAEPVGCALNAMVGRMAPMIRASSPAPDIGRIEGVALIVADLEAAIGFYHDGLGFALDARSCTGATLSLGGVTLRLDLPAQPGRPYPSERSANDPWFQHFAIRVADMNAAYARLSAQTFTAISGDGPQQLPASSGSVIAFKFRDPDGHPLELSHYPGQPQSCDGSPFLSIDHSAIAVGNLQASTAFYRDRLGFRLAERLVNQGPTQWRLDGMEGALVDIVVLRPPAAGPHLELLHYRFPVSVVPPAAIAPNDISATRLLVSKAGGHLGILTDPDGHMVELVEPRPSS
jgi:catechol 2,3-dioxygenase-like lactoylglutathione lyase family enzyme